MNCHQTHWLISSTAVIVRVLFTSLMLVFITVKAVPSVVDFWTNTVSLMMEVYNSTTIDYTCKFLSSATELFFSENLVTVIVSRLVYWRSVLKEKASQRGHWSRGKITFLLINSSVFDMSRSFFRQRITENIDRKKKEKTERMSEPKTQPDLFDDSSMSKRAGCHLQNTNQRITKIKDSLKNFVDQLIREKTTLEEHHRRAIFSTAAFVIMVFSQRMSLVITVVTVSIVVFVWTTTETYIFLRWMVEVSPLIICS